MQPAMKSVMHGSLILRQLSQQVAQARNMSVGKRRRKSALLRKIRSKRIRLGFVRGKKPIVSETYENERIFIKNSKPYIKCVLRLSRVVHGPIYGRFMGRNGFLSPMFADVHISNLGWGDLERARERATQQFVPGSRESAVREECQHMGTVCCNGTSLGRLYFAVFRA